MINATGLAQPHRRRCRCDSKGTAARAGRRNVVAGARAPARCAAALSACVVALGVVGCTTMRVGSDYDRNAAFSNYHTFALMKREHRGTRNPLVITRTEDAIKEDLTRKGYSLASDDKTADFAVDFTIGSRERTDLSSYPPPYAGPWWRGAWWGGPYWGNNIDVRQFREGTLSIDVFDGQSHRPVWHGWARKELTRSDIAHSEEPIRKAVDSVLARFPPHQGGTGIE